MGSMASKLNFDFIGAIGLWALTVLCVSSCTSIASATQPCRQFFVQKVVAAPVVAYAAPVYYQAGVGIEQDALAAKVAKIVVGQLRAELQASSIRQQQTAKQSTALSQHCAKCHSGATPKGGITIDGETPMDCWQITASLRAIAADTMPKDHKIPPEVKGQAMQELLDLEQSADRPRSVQVQAPEASGELK